VLPIDWFERAVIEFGQATGVAASGLLLLGMADPDNRSEAIGFATDTIYQYSTA
jgi:ESS family glutamate:Na+ symporter